ncbi:MAG: NAD+ synthase (glutamine-hydrolyzing) [Gammaproteobacteria bacterium]|jgi:NAD+ synthase (glutamine-hydrolysing)
MSQKIKICLAQINLLVGDIDGNINRIIQAAETARDELSARIIVFPELTVTGYPPEDLLLREDFLRSASIAMSRLTDHIKGICCVIGCPVRLDDRLHNAAVVIDSGRELARYYKQALPNYNVFDEARYFVAGNQPTVFSLEGTRFGVTICEDVWEPLPVQASVGVGAEIILNLNASPFDMHKSSEREDRVVGALAKKYQIPIVYTNLVGGQDELVFDGCSFVVDNKGVVVHRSIAFEESLSTVSIGRDGNGIISVHGTQKVKLPGLEARIYQALVTGVRDYIEKNGFKGVVLGLSGGIDSALTLAIAVDALGADRVEAVTMPSRFTRDISIEDALLECEWLGVTCHQINIEPMFESFLTALNPVLNDYAPDTTEENIQARCRGVLLMAISNKTGNIVLTTGNKSEMAVGYATLYGDMAGGFAAIKDVPKTLVYRLARYRNEQAMAIPERVIDRAPSAELAHDQKDEDSLPPYDILDAILQAYVEEDQSVSEIIRRGFNADEVSRVVKMVIRNEYKRRQAPPGVRITKRAFGRDRRYPLTSGYTYM